MESVRVHEGRTAFFIDGKYYSYAELGSAILKIAGMIKKHCTGEGVIGVFSGNNLETYAALYATWYSGKAYTPLNLGSPPDRNIEITRQAGIRSVICSKTYPDRTEYRDAGLKFLEFESATGELPEENIIIPGDEDLAYVLFTSGSTGKPKGVPIPFSSLNSFIAHFMKDYDISENDRFLQIYDLSFDGAIPCYIAPLCFGSSIYTVAPGEIKYLSAYKLMRDHELTVIKMTPSVLGYLKPFFKDIYLPSVRYSIFGGEAFSAVLAKAWGKCVPNARLQNVYGPTESTVFCLRYEWKSGEPFHVYNGIVSLGMPVGENYFKVIRKENNSFIFFKKGELCVAGPQVFTNYIGQEANEDHFVRIDENGKMVAYYRTGDIVQSLENGEFAFSGRNDSQVQIQGFRVELIEIENHARDFLGIENVAALVVNNKAGIPEIHLCIESAGQEKDGLVRFLRTHLPYYMIPGNIHYIHPFPLSMGGKTDRNQLKKMVRNVN